MPKHPTVTMDSVAQDQIRAFFERWHRLEEEKQAISDDLKELFAEAKGNGFDTKVLRKLFRDKVGDHDERMEFEAIYELYAAALGMGPMIEADPSEEPRARPARSAREIIEEFPPHDSETGEIIEDNEPADREHITGSVGKEFPNNEPAHPATPEVAAAAGSDPASEADDAEEPPQAEASSATQSTEEQTEQVAGQIGNALEQDRESGVTTQPVDTPHAANTNFRRIQVLGSINE